MPPKMCPVEKITTQANQNGALGDSGWGFQGTAGWGFQGTAWWGTRGQRDEGIPW